MRIARIFAHHDGNVLEINTCALEIRDGSLGGCSIVKRSSDGRHRSSPWS
jgi:hypothetical protein